MIAWSNISMRAGQFALDEISLRVETGQYGVLMGRTGRGKTTLLEATCGLRRIAAGRIVLHDVDVTNLTPAEREIGYLPQDLALFPTHTVRDHLEFALRLRKTTAVKTRRRVDELSEFLGIRALLDRRPLGLSGGEAQRVALGRALSFHPRVLLLDEPLSALDQETREEMYALLRSVRDATGVTVLHVTHNLQDVAALGDRVFVLDQGRIVEVEPGDLPKTATATELSEKAQ